MIEQLGDEVWLTSDLQPPFGRGINLQIELNDIQPLYDRLVAIRYPFFRDIAVQWYTTGATDAGVREFLVQDPDGYLLRFSQDLGERPRQE